MIDLEELEEKQLMHELVASKKIMEILRDKMGCRRPAFALYQIKRAIVTGRKDSITLAKIRVWGR